MASSENLCEKCQNLSFDALGQRSGLEHYPHVRMLRTEAERENGCSLCALLWQSIRSDRFRVPDILPVRLYLNPPSQYSARPLQIEVVVGSPEKVAGLGWARRLEDEPWVLGPPDKDVPEVSRGHLMLYGIHGNPASAFFKHKLVEVNADSAQCSNIARDLLEECLKNHRGICAGTATNFVPARLVDVGPEDGSQDPHLWSAHEQQQPGSQDECELRGLKPRYAALSYCWGDIPFLTLTSSNTEALKSGIPMDDLPPTIRDAIKVVRRLGIRFLWVDSLCILQGSDKGAQADWALQSVKMNRIYQEAVLTIAAAAASNAYGGIFQPRRRETPGCLLKYPSSSVLEVRGTVLVSLRHQLRLVDRVEPLYRRAWTLQEILMSTRVLQFGTSEMTRKCRFETFTESEGKKCSYANIVSPPAMNFSYENYGAPQDQEVKRLSSHWMSIVEDYSGREMTRISDKLPALAGLAALVHESSGDEYLAGIWQNKLPEQLLWKHTGKIVDRRQEYPKPTSYRAPSWIWTSVDGKVEFCKWTEWQPSREVANTSTRIISCHVKTTLPDGFGEVFAGELVVEGLVKWLPTIRREAVDLYYGCYERYFPWIHLENGLVTYLDNVDELAKDDETTIPGAPKELLNTWFLFLDGVPSRGLILSRAMTELGDMPVLKRIGMFEGYHYQKGDIEKGEIQSRIFKII